MELSYVMAGVALVVIIIFFIIDWRKIEFHGIDGNHLEFNAALRTRNNFSYVLELFIDNGFAFRTVAHNLPPICSRRPRRYVAVINIENY